MATKVLKNWYASLNGVVLTAYVRDVKPNFATQTAINTAGAAVTAHTYVPLLNDATIAFTFNLELGAGAVEATLWAIYDGNAAVTLVWAADGATPGAANPVYTATGILTSYAPFEGEVGTKGEVTVNFQLSGALARDITP